MDCKVCNHSGIDEGAITCPKCNSDLEVFSLIQSVENSARSLKRVIWILVIIIIAVVAVWGYNEYGPGNAAAVAEENEANLNVIKTLQDENAELKNNIIKLEQRLTEAEQKALDISSTDGEAGITDGTGDRGTTGDKTHIVQQGETLWSIALEKYGNGMKFQKIASDNDLPETEWIYPGTKLILYD